MKIFSQKTRPYLILLATVLVLAVIDRGRGNVLSGATVFSALQYLATLGPVALGLSLTMLVREFDLSVAGVFGLAGCVAVLLGGDSPALGLAAAVLAGAASGFIQGLIITRLQMPSIGVTLGGLLTTIGLAYVLTGNQSLTFDNMDLALFLSARIGLFTPRSIVALALAAAFAMALYWLWIGRDLIAIGSDRRAAHTAGVRVDALMVLVFTTSGALAALSGALLSYSLASASPSGLSEVLVPATAAAILGGVSLSGGTGTPLGVTAGVLMLGVLRAGLNALGAPPFAHDMSMGAVLLAVAILDAPGIRAHFERLQTLTRSRTETQAP
ncbi:ABC transporter permease [Roseiarcaceae bacterium H3SJ34-1]|uniref:ABC transporter permease n=1 Tax=Terripilifer ovatus TaxID=3032367 RepID=UPI003AB95808|nr:ABC transporter permease [Roseiarcaceae bacterium H3SJ34-1]